VARCFPTLRAEDTIVDVGGGDGELLNAVLALNKQARVTMIDISPRVGTSLSPEIRERVTYLPGTSIRDYIAQGHPAPNVAIVGDVVHHVPPALRRQFFADLLDLFAGRPGRLVIKDVEPGSLMATAAYWGDRYISGDKTARFLGAVEMKSLVIATLPSARITDTPLFQRNPPNYCLIVDT
jgi:2-polyprenyl-3-methyl-5-hydroxy-6-metoxy-1,4-benzoquinol methylase